MIRSVIIDDEKNCLEMMEYLLLKHCPQVKVLQLCRSAQEGISAIEAHKPDLVFLDIEMPRMNGFDMLKSMNDIRFNVIFTTAYDQFAIKAFRFSAIDYLLKPIDPEELREAVGKHESMNRPLSKPQLDSLYEHMGNKGEGLRKIALTTSESLIFVDTEKIICCESDSNYTYFHLQGGEKILVSKTLKEAEELLSGMGFFRIHASYLINMKHVAKFVRGDGGYVLMSNNQHITVSRKKKEEFFDLFSRL
jgi:two-component system LytT family response regulator